MVRVERTKVTVLSVGSVRFIWTLALPIGDTVATVTIGNAMYVVSPLTVVIVNDVLVVGGFNDKNRNGGTHEFQSNSS